MDPSLIRIARAPGRVNLIGEHTDYNDGFVLPIAIDRNITIAFVPSADRRVELTLGQTGETGAFNIDAIGPATGGWIDHVAGTAKAMADYGLPVQGFRGVLTSDLPQAAGLSSSAALELASALALSGVAEPIPDRWLLARICQAAENRYIGVKCGLMDQFASACGQEGAALLLDCRSGAYIPVPLALRDVALVVCWSGSARRLGRSEYNHRREQCAAAVDYFAARNPLVHSLRDVSSESLERASREMEQVLTRRARHVVHENVRVLETVTALLEGDYEHVGRLLTASHVSLRDLFEVSSPELDALVEVADAVPGVLGSRMTGAGFGGCTVTLVRRDSVDRLADNIRNLYPARTGLTPEVFEVKPASGATLARG